MSGEESCLGIEHRLPLLGNCLCLTHFSRDEVQELAQELRENMDAVGMEIRTNLLWICSRAIPPNSEESDVDSSFLTCIVGTDSFLAHNAPCDPTIGALLVLYRRTMITKDNLEALCKICSGSVPVNAEIQNYAIIVIDKICEIRSIWKLKMSTTNGSTVALHLLLVRAMVMFIENTVSGKDDGTNELGENASVTAWTILDQSLTM